nr:heparan-alpha-glucosaminide N-acetyltransferase domain-containing protein [Kineococcus vitellinus]
MRWQSGAVTTPAEPTTAPRAPARTGGRITSLDVVRGLMLVVSVAVNSLVVTPPWFEHAEWEGVHGLDLVFPVFVTLTGCGLGFAMHRRTEVGGLARRVLVLLAVGLLYNALVANPWSAATWRYPGVLQLYAGVVLVLALGHLLTRSARGWFAIALVLALVWTGVLAWFATTCPGGELTRACNPSGVVDPAVFGAAHVYGGGQPGHDPEGLPAVLGACVSAAAGACVGHLLLSARSRGRGTRAATAPVLAAAAAFALLAGLTAAVPGLLTGHEVPAMKRLWTPPFALAVAAAVAVVLLAGHLLLDSRRTPALLRRAVWPLEALGRNSLLVYFGSHVVAALVLHRAAPDVLERLHSAQWQTTAVAVLAWTALAALLHRLRVYLRP